MALTHNEFDVLLALSQTGERLTQREIAKKTGLSVGSVNAAIRSCEQKGLADDGRITLEGGAALEPYRVDNAIIMAAGLSSRFVPISYERPKGVLTVKGQVLIERQIEQLLERGISDITVVVGYRKEFFFYLAQKYGVKLVVNDDYATKNNCWTLWLVRNRLANTYICSSDDYFEENPFERYVWHAYYAAQYVEGPTDEWCLKVGANDRITGVTVGGSDAWVMLGHAYFDRDFSRSFVQILERELQRPETEDKLWESIYASHLGVLDMKIRRYPEGTIKEFDSLAELEDFDPSFISNVDSSVFDNIVSILGCKREEITDFHKLSQGLTNLSCTFTVDGKRYVYRHPGIGTEKMINRQAETQADEAARDLGVDKSFIYEDAKQGWKISHFLEGARRVDATNDAELRAAMTTSRTIHESGVKIDAPFDYFENGLGYERILASHGPIQIPGYDELRDKIVDLNELSAGDEYEKVFSHVDYLPDNIMVCPDGSIDVIDWEFSGMADPYDDLATFIVCAQLDSDRTELALSYYLDRTPTDEERRHLWSRVTLCGWCWYVWALAKEAEGAPVGEWLYIYYRYAIENIDGVLDMYRKAA